MSVSASARFPRWAQQVRNGTARAAAHRERFATLTAQVTRVAAVWSIVALLLRRVHHLHRVDDLFGVLNLPVAPSLFTVVLLFVLAGALRRRLRVALLVLVVFQLLGILYGVLSLLLVAAPRPAAKAVGHGDIGQAFLLAGLLAGIVLSLMLWWARPAFPARLVPASRVRALAVLAAGLVVSAVLSITLTELVPGTLRPGRQRVEWALRITAGLPPDSDDLQYGARHGPHWVVTLVGAVSAAALVAALLVFLRAGRRQRLLTAADELRIRGLLAHDGERDSLGYFATRRDKSAVFSPREDSAVTYRVVGSVGLASADPVGPPTAWDAAISEWLATMRRYGWSPAAVSTSEQGAEAYVRAGLRAVLIGDEAVVDVASFTLDGPTMEPVRRAVTRVSRAGYTARVTRHGDLLPAELAALERHAEAWRGPEEERGFSMALGRFGDPADARCVAVTAFDRDGEIRGLLSFVPWGARGLSLDVMRRDRDAENGTTEFLVAELLRVCPDLAITRVSLNFAAFRAVFSAAERVGAGPLVRLGNSGLTVASRFWQLKSLYRSNERYLPSWNPRFLCYDSAALTSVVAAAGVAEGFLPGFSGRLGRAVAPAATARRPDPVSFAAQVADQEHIARPAPPIAVTTEQQRIRRAKLDALVAAGMEPYPVRVPRTGDITALRRRFAGLAAGADTGEQVSVCGRVRALRDHGGLVFADLQEGEDRVQVLTGRRRLGRDPHRLWRHTVDLGDLVSVTGTVVTSHSGELSIEADTWAMAAKCLHPLPAARKGLTDLEARARQRHVDLIVNADSRRLLAQRSAATRAIRDGLQRRGFTEVETPMLQAVHGGANARPFTTHSNAYHLPLHLRIAPELFLKRLAVGGLGKVFELGRNFRNEGADSTHNPEFTSVEAYQAHADYTVMRELTRELILEVAIAVHGAPVAHRRRPGGAVDEVDLSAPWPVVTVHHAVSRATGTEVTVDTPKPRLRELCLEHGVGAPADAGDGQLLGRLYDELVEKRTTSPTFYTDFPIATSPLTRPHRSARGLAERWDLVAFGTELGTAYSELTDPIDQRQRLTDQSLLAAAGDPDAMELDEDFLTALEHAMPPTGGLGLGVDRIVMMLTGTSIRAILAFPFVRPGRH